MGQCYGKNTPGAGNSNSNDNDNGDENHHGRQNATTIIAATEYHRSPVTIPSVKSTPARSSSHASPWPSPYPHGVNPSPSPARTSTPRRFFRRPFPPPSPAKHIRESLAKRLGKGKPKEGPIPEERGVEVDSQSLDKSFGYSKNFGAKYELGKEVGRGHFGHTCSARAKKGDLKDQPVAVKIISKSKVIHCFNSVSISLFFDYLIRFLWFSLILYLYVH